MLQQINLYQDRFKEKKVVPSARHSLFLVALIMIVVASMAYTQSESLVELDKQSVGLAEENKNLLGQIAFLKAKIDKILADDGLTEVITKTNREIASSQKVLRFVKRRQFGSGESFSQYLVALSRLSQENVWLRKINLSAQFMRLEGSSLNEENIPRYFQKFSGEDLFDGMSFDVFEMARPSAQDWKVDFIIASKQTSNDKKVEVGE